MLRENRGAPRSLEQRSLSQLPARRQGQARDEQGRSARECRAGRWGGGHAGQVGTGPEGVGDGADFGVGVRPALHHEVDERDRLVRRPRHHLHVAFTHLGHDACHRPRERIVFLVAARALVRGVEVGQVARECLENRKATLHVSGNVCQLTHEVR